MRRDMATGHNKMAGSPAVAWRDAARRLGLDDVEPERREAARRFPVRFTEYYLGLAETGGPDDPIRRIGLPEPAEIAPDPASLVDPVGERARSPAPYVVRKHADRAILLVSSRCHVYCRFCFRRTFPDGRHADPDPAALDAAIAYLAGEDDLREVILSGGDPLALQDDELRTIVRRLSALPQLVQLRVHTRAPVHDPARVTPELADALVSGLPLSLVMHFDHPREITDETRRVAGLLLGRGIPLLNQSVLLRGVNDDPATLEELFRALWRERIKPYYLHHPDRVPGAGSFWLSIERGLEIYRELSRRLGGGPALPAYVIDPPDGSGKVPVETLV
jgi:lysine 2,3-aminomutase